MSGSEPFDPPGDKAVPSHGTMFDEPGDSPSVVPQRAAVVDRGRLYRSAGAEGGLAGVAIPALVRAPAIDPSLPQSPEAVARESVAIEVAPPEAVTPDAPEPAVEAAAVMAIAEEHAPLPAPLDVATEGEAEPAPVIAAVLPVVTQTVNDVPPEIVDSPETVSPAEIAMPLLPPPGAPPIEVTPQPVQPIAPASGTPLFPVPVEIVTSGSPLEPAAGAPSLQTNAPRAATVLPGTPAPGTGLSWTRGSLIIIGVTVVAAFIDAFLRHGLGTITGLALIGSSAFVAMRLKRADIWAAVIMPPLAFLAAIATAGQLSVASTGSLISRQALNIVTGLSLNAPWILAATLIALLIVLIRRHREKLVEPVPVVIVDDLTYAP
ncbi:MAG: DUF6542 domain-containing protein [Actinomycetes bacterium]